MKVSRTLKLGEKADENSGELRLDLNDVSFFAVKKFYVKHGYKPFFSL